VRAGAAAALALLAGACAPTYPIAPAQPETAAPTAAPAPLAPPPVAAAPAPQSPVPRPSAGDQCGAAELQRLVGRSRREIPVPLDPNRQRVACTTCPITEDLDPGRLNFFFDAGTGLIKEVRCG
jgi:hypothetical protein